MKKYYIMKFNTYEILIILILALIASWYLVPAMQYLLRAPGLIGLFFFFIIITFNYNTKVLIAYSVLFLLLITSLNIVYFGIWRNTGYIPKMLSLSYFFIPMFLSTFLIKSEKEKIKKVTFFIIIYMFFFTIFTTLVGLSIHPEASRILATSNTNIEIISSYKILNIGGYGFIYALVFAAPLIIYFNKIRKINNLTLLFMISTVLYTVIISQYTIAILLVFMLLFCVVVLGKINVYKTLIIFISLVITIKYGFTILGNVTKGISELIKIEAVSIRFQEISNYFIYSNITNTSDLGTRFKLYSESLSSFISNPFIGNLSFKNYDISQLGYHSEILDLMGGVGILGLIPMIILLTYFVKLVFVNLHSSLIKKYLNWILIYVIIFSSLNTIFSSFEIGFVLFFLLPIANSFEKKEFFYKDANIRSIKI